MLIALAGLPGTGKSTLADLLAARLPGVVLDQDRIRACLVPPGDITFSAGQDDYVMYVVYRVADQLVLRVRDRHVLIDGRTFSKDDQMSELLRWVDPPRPAACRDDAGHRRSPARSAYEEFRDRPP